MSNFGIAITKATNVDLTHPYFRGANQNVEIRRRNPFLSFPVFCPSRKLSNFLKNNMTNKGFGFCEECDTPCDFIKNPEMMITYEGYYDRDVPHR